MTKAKSSKTSPFFLIGSWLMVLISIGHSVGAYLSYLQSSGPLSTNLKEIFPSGKVGHNLFEYYVGDSIGMGLMYLAYGVLNLLVARAFRARKLAVPRPVILVSVWMTLFGLILALIFFPLAPILIQWVALCFFVMAWKKAPAR
jgi:hypothetical protein